MTKKENVLKVIEDIKHPAIDNSLVNLGIVKNIEVEENTVKLVFAFPFPKIPIADALINSIGVPLQEIGYTLKYDIVTMNEKEKEEFLQLETKGWIG